MDYFKRIIQISQPSRGRPWRGQPRQGWVWMTLDFNSNWVFFTNNDCLKVDIQFQEFLKIPKFGLTEGIIFNSENYKLSCSQKWWYWQISEMGGENSKIFFSIASCCVWPSLKNILVPRPLSSTGGHRCKVGEVGSRFWWKYENSHFWTGYTK